MDAANRFKIRQLTPLRFIAASSIVVYHFGLTSFPFDQILLHDFFSQSSFFVSFFFILSGYVLTYVYLPKLNKHSFDLTQYFLARFLRIYPVYFLALLLYSLLDLYVKNDVSSGDFILSALLVQSWFPGHATALNFPGWSLSVEALFYASFPFIILSIVRYSIATHKLVVIVAAFWFFSLVLLKVMLYFFHTPNKILNELCFYFPLMHLHEFCIGIVSGVLFAEGKVNRGDYKVQITIIILLIMLVPLAKLDPIFHNGAFALLFVPFIILISSDDGIYCSILSTRFLEYLGEISFGIYILQVPVFRITKRLFQMVEWERSSAYFYFSFLMLILFSVASYKLVESPIKRFVNSKVYSSANSSK